jgi:hypothetical protein
LSTGSPAGWICPELVVSAMVVVMLNEAGVRIFNVTATVAIVEIAARSVRASRNKTFMFNFSPPFCFLLQKIIFRDEKKKSYMQLASRSSFYRCVRFGI